MAMIGAVFLLDAGTHICRRYSKTYIAQFNQTHISSAAIVNRAGPDFLSGRDYDQDFLTVHPR
jgi:hypothetical protein